jgi:hypothetical protein
MLQKKRKELGIEDKPPASKKGGSKGTHNGGYRRPMWLWALDCRL